MKPTSRFHWGFIAATQGLTASLTLLVVFSVNVLLAQTAPSQNVSGFDPIPVAAAPQTVSPQVRQQASYKLHHARKAVANRDIATAEKLLNEVMAMQLTYQQGEDNPALVQKLIQDYRHLAEMAKTQGNTEQFRREYARFNLVQADTMLLRKELDLAAQLTQEAAKQQVQYSQADKNSGLEPTVMARRIDDVRRAQSLNTHVASIQDPQPLSQASQEHLKQALQLLQQGRLALEAGQLDQAERHAKAAAAYNLPEYAFQGNTPNRFLAEIAARRQGMTANAPTTVADSQSVVYRPEQDQPHVLQAVANNPTLAPQIPVPGRNTPYIDQTIQNRQAIISQFSSDVIQKLSDAQRMCEEQRKPDAALDMLHDLKRKVEQSSQLDSAAKGMYVQQIDRAIEKTVGFREQYTSQERQKQTNEEVWAQLRHDQEKFRNKEAQLDAYFKQHKKLLDEQRYEEALLVARKAKEFAPEEPAVQMMLTMSQLVYNNSRSVDIRDIKRDGVVNELLAVDETSIIPNFGGSSMLYSPRWADITDRRNASNKTLLWQRPEMEQRILQQLEMPVTFNINQPIPLEQALQLLCGAVEIAHYLDQSALDEVEIPTGTMVKMPVANAIKMKSVLTLILEQHGLAYTVENEMLNITSKKRARGKLIPRLHYVGDIRDLDVPIMEANLMEESFNRGFQKQRPDFQNRNNMYMPAIPGVAPRPDGMPVSSNGMPYPAEGDPNIHAQYGGGYGGGMGGGYGGGMGGRSGGYGGGMGGGMGFGSIVQIIQTVIEPLSWSPNMGGEGLGEGMIEYHYATQSLAIRQTEEVHAQIEDLLTQIRKMNDLQIAVEVRYITLSDSFFEKMGTAFDMAFNNDGAFGRITQNTNTFTGPDGTPVTTSTTRGDNVVIGLDAPRVLSATASIPVTQDSFGMAMPAFGGFNPTAGISTGFALLSNIETYFFISAAQGDRRNSVMEAPKVMLHNGQPGMVNDTTQIPFVTSVTPVVADFAVSYQPVITMLNQGQVLHVQANVARDRQHVLMSLNPTFSTLIRTQTFKYFGDDTDTEETSTTRGDDTATTSTDPRSNSKRRTTSKSGVTIQQPIWATFSVSTTVNCPDGGTVLLGGIKRLSEGRVEGGVPILNKLPYIQRLFSNTAIGRDTQSIMIMVTPRIIIQEEEESFIMGSTRP